MKENIEEELYNSLRNGKLNDAIFILNQKIQTVEQRLYIFVIGLSLLILSLSAVMSCFLILVTKK